MTGIWFWLFCLHCACCGVVGLGCQAWLHTHERRAQNLVNQGQRWAMIKPSAVGLFNQAPQVLLVELAIHPPKRDARLLDPRQTSPVLQANTHGLYEAVGCCATALRALAGSEPPGTRQSVGSCTRHGSQVASNGGSSSDSGMPGWLRCSWQRPSFYWPRREE